MPKTRVCFYGELSGEVPVLDWLRSLRKKDLRAYLKCVSQIEQLAAFGYELRRPDADYLREGIYELRIRKGRVHYRVLYFFLGQGTAILTHGLTKEGRVPPGEIDRAIGRKKACELNPQDHVYEEEHD